MICAEELKIRTPESTGLIHCWQSVLDSMVRCIQRSWLGHKSFPVTWGTQPFPSLAAFALLRPNFHQSLCEQHHTKNLRPFRNNIAYNLSPF